MAQDFSYRYPLVDGQGNFGSVDGDPPAAMRYTEARMAPFAEALLEDIDKDTVDFVPNYDEDREEPSYLPSKIPNLLVNGSGGIAVGMATNMPPHNLTEVCEAVDPSHRAIPTLRLEDIIEHDSRSGFSNGRLHLRPRRNPAGLSDRPRSDHDARARDHRAAGQRIATSSSSPKFRIRSTRRG